MMFVPLSNGYYQFKIKISPHAVVLCVCLTMCVEFQIHFKHRLEISQVGIGTTKATQSCIKI